MMTFKQFIAENWAVTGAKPGTVVSVTQGGTFNGKTKYFLAKAGKWVQVNAPEHKEGKIQSTIMNGGDTLSDEELSKSAPALVREPHSKLDSIYDLEAMASGAKIKRNTGEIYTKSGDEWKKEGSDQTYSVIYMTGVLGPGVTQA